jgi:hypothetical protein
MILLLLVESPVLMYLGTTKLVRFQGLWFT